MKNLFPAYLLILLIVFSAGLSKAQNRGKIISPDQIIILDPNSGIFKIQNMNEPKGEVGDSIEIDMTQNNLAFASSGIPTNQLVATVRNGSDVGEILSMEGARSQSGQIMYKQGGRFTLISYKRQRLSPDLDVGSCVSFKIKRGSVAVDLAASQCDF